jgi:hypothetical protein
MSCILEWLSASWVFGVDPKRALLFWVLIVVGATAVCVGLI